MIESLCGGGVEKRKVSYSIASTEFQVGGKNVQQINGYHFPETVTRENFTSFLTHSFARSRGRQSFLWLQFEWLNIHTGFDYNDTFNSFLNSGGVSTFSLVEKVSFLEEFKRIDNPQHRIIRDQATILPSLEINLRNMIGISPDGMDRVAAFRKRFLIEEIKSYKDAKSLFEAMNNNKTRKNVL